MLRPASSNTSDTERAFHNTGPSDEAPGVSGLQAVEDKSYDDLPLTIVAAMASRFSLKYTKCYSS